MAEYIWYKGKMWHYTALLEYLGRGVHFAILPDGQIIRHAEHMMMMYHAKGFNMKSVGVELIVPGVYDLDGLYRKINRECMAYDVYTRDQYRAILLLLGYLASYGYLKNPRTDWGLHEHHSQDRKRDPGAAFDATTLKELALGYFIGE